MREEDVKGEERKYRTLQGKRDVLEMDVNSIRNGMDPYFIKNRIGKEYLDDLLNFGEDREVKLNYTGMEELCRGEERGEWN